MSDNTPEQTPIEASIPRPEGESQPSIRLAEKHPLAIRWMHWINFPLLFIMIWSGLLIYWADSIPRARIRARSTGLESEAGHCSAFSLTGSGKFSTRPTGSPRAWATTSSSCGSSLQMASFTCSIRGSQGNGGIWFQTETPSVKPGR